MSTEAAAAAPPIAPSSPQWRVVIVEDSRTTAAILQKMLTAWGYDVAVAHNVSDGVELVSLFRPAAVVCDICLEGADDGYALADALRKLGKDRPKLIACTGFTATNDRRRSLETGFDYHLRKPIAPDVLRATLRLTCPERQTIR